MSSKMRLNAKDVILERGMMDQLGRHILNQDIESAEECLREIYRFRQEQVERLLGQRGTEFRQLKSDFKRKQNAQPEGSLKQVLQTALKSLANGYSKQRPDLVDYGEGLLEWIRLQVQYVIPFGRRELVTDQLNAVMDEKFDQDEVFSYDINQEEGGVGFGFDFDVAEIKNLVKRQRPDEKSSRSAQPLAEQVEDVEEGAFAPPVVPPLNLGAVDPEQLIRQLDASAEPPASELSDELLDSMIGVHQSAAVGISGAKDESGEATIVNVYRRYLPSNAFAERYSDNPKFGVPLPPYPSLVLGSDAATDPLLLNLPQRQKAAGLFLLDWVENLLAAYQDGLSGDDIIFRDGIYRSVASVDNERLRLESGGVTIDAIPRSKRVEIAGASDSAATRDQAAIASAFAMTWLIDGSGSDITVVEGDGAVRVYPGAASTIAVRDYLRDDLCTRLGQGSQPCADLGALFQLASGEAAPILSEQLISVARNMGVRIVALDTPEAKACATGVDFKTLCRQCTERSGGGGCDSDDPNSLMQFDGDPERFEEFADYVQVFDPKSHEDALLRSKRLRGSKQIYDLRPRAGNAVLLMAVSDGYEVNQINGRLSGSIEPDFLAFEVAVAPGKYSGTELAVALQTALNTVGSPYSYTFSVAWEPFSAGCSFHKFVIALRNRSTLRGQGINGFTLNFSPEAAQLWGFAPGETRVGWRQSSDRRITMLERAQGFVLAARGSLSFPESDGAYLEYYGGKSARRNSNRNIDSAALANAVEIKTLCKKKRAQSDPLTLLLALQVLAMTHSKDSVLAGAGHVLLDLPKAVRIAEFQESDSGSTTWRAVEVNSGAHYIEASAGLKLDRAFPEWLRKQPDFRLIERDDVRSISSVVVNGEDLTERVVGSEEFFYLLEGPASFKAEHNGPWAINGDEWIGLMVREMPSERDLLELLQAVKTAVQIQQGPAPPPVLSTAESPLPELTLLPELPASLPDL